MKKLKNSELDRISVEEFKKSKKIPITILLENIRSAHNIGSVFRTADSFLINEIIILPLFLATWSCSIVEFS